MTAGIWWRNYRPAARPAERKMSKKFNEEEGAEEENCGRENIDQ